MNEKTISKLKHKIAHQRFLYNTCQIDKKQYIKIINSIECKIEKLENKNRF